MDAEDEQLYRELRLSHKALQGMDENMLVWLGYFYDTNVPSVKIFLDRLAMTEGVPPEDVLSSFEDDLNTLIEHRINELLSIEENLDPQIRQYILANWKASEALFSALTEHFIIRPSENTRGELAVLVMQDQEKIKGILEAARSNEGLINFMRLCDKLAKEMEASAYKRFSMAPFLEKLNELDSLKLIINPDDVKRLILMQLSGKESDGVEKRRGFRRLLKVLEARGFFKT